MAQPSDSTPALPDGVAIREAEDRRVEITVDPIRRDEYKKDYVHFTTEEKVEMEQIQYIERVKEVPKPYTVTRHIPVPKVEVTERTVEIPKYVHEETVVEVPQVQIVDKVKEVVQYIPQARIIERPQIMLQERIIPICRRRIEEQIVEVPKEEYEQILKAKLPEAEYYPPQMEGKYAMETETPVEVEAEVPRQEYVEIPHVQHLYRNVMQPEFRHVPKPVGVAISHLAPNQIATLVDRNVPIPVELEVVQEFLCPRVEPIYTEVPVPITVTRKIEKPIPADAMLNSFILDAYLKEHPQPVTPCLQHCMGPPKILKSAMDEIQLTTHNLSAQPSFSQAVPFESRGVTVSPQLRMQTSGPLLLQPRSIAQPCHNHV